MGTTTKLGRLRFGQALRRILCPHDRQGGMTDEHIEVRWCEDCGHTEVVLPAIAPHGTWVPGRAWNSAMR